MSNVGQLGYSCDGEGACAAGLVCRDDVCYSEGCTPSPNFSLHCHDNNVVWYDNCGARGTVARHCGGNGCSESACGNPTWAELRLSENEPDLSEQENTEILDIAMAMDGPDQLYVAWTGARNDSETQEYGTGVFVRKWTPAGGWSYLGPGMSATGYDNFRYYTEVHLLASNGAVLRATRANDPDNGLHTVIGVDRWTGTEWEQELFRAQAGNYQVQFDPQTQGMFGSAPRLASNRAGKVILVWTEWDSNYDPNADYNALYVARRSNIAGWSPYGPGSASGAGSVGFQETRSHPGHATVAENGDVYLVWTSYVAGRRTIQFRRDTRGSWLAPGASSGQIATPNEDDGFVSTVADSLGSIYFAWTHENASGTNQFVARLDLDGSHREVGVGSASSSGLTGSILKSDAPKIVLDGNELPIVVWREAGRPKAKRWDGSEWRNYGQGGTADVLGDTLFGGSIVGAFAVAAAGNRLCLSWARVESTPATPPGLRVTCTQPSF